MLKDYINTEKNIHRRIFKYVVVGLKAIRRIPKNSDYLPIIDQLVRSLTSIGANDQEADAAGSSRDFIAKYVIVRKETKETVYWWEVLGEIGFKDSDLAWLISEGKEIFSIVNAIIRNSKAKNFH